MSVTAAARASVLLGGLLGMGTGLAIYGPEYMDYQRAAVIPHRRGQAPEVGFYYGRGGKLGWPGVRPEMQDIIPGLAYMLLGMEQPFARATALRALRERTGLRVGAGEIYWVHRDRLDKQELFALRVTPEDEEVLGAAGGVATWRTDESVWGIRDFLDDVVRRTLFTHLVFQRL